MPIAEISIRFLQPAQPFPVSLILPIPPIATLCTNGALIVAGGVGIGENLNVCGIATFGGARSAGLNELRALFHALALH